MYENSGSNRVSKKAATTMPKPIRGAIMLFLFTAAIISHIRNVIKQMIRAKYTRIITPATANMISPFL